MVPFNMLFALGLSGAALLCSSKMKLTINTVVDNVETLTESNGEPRPTRTFSEQLRTLEVEIKALHNSPTAYRTRFEVFLVATRHWWPRRRVAGQAGQPTRWCSVHEFTLIVGLNYYPNYYPNYLELFRSNSCTNFRAPLRREQFTVNTPRALLVEVFYLKPWTPSFGVLYEVLHFL